MGIRRWAPLAAGTAALLVIAGALALRAVRSPHGARPSAAPPLRMTSSAPAAPVAGAAGRRSEIRSTVSLPRARPPATPVQWLADGPAPEATVRRLAAALHVPAPRREGAGWIAGAGDRILRVTAGPGRPWRFGAPEAPAGHTLGPGPHSPDTSLASTRLCAAEARKCWPAEVPLRIPAPTATGRPDHVTLGAAARVLAAAGLPSDVARVRDRVVSVDPTVAGLPTTGVTTSVVVDAGGRVRAASGWLVQTRPGPAYPVVSASRAFTLVRQRPPQAATCRRADERGACASPLSITVTHARLGLALEDDDGTPLLVPAWLFVAADGSEPLVQVAVDPAYLQPATSPTPAGSASAPSPRGGSAPSPRGGSASSPRGASAVPGAPAAGHARLVRFDGAMLARDGRALRVQPQAPGLGCGTRFTAAATETASDVVVRVVAVPASRGYHACVLLEPTLALRAPLQARVLIDAFDGGVRRVTGRR